MNKFLFPAILVTIYLNSFGQKETVDTSQAKVNPSNAAVKVYDRFVNTNSRLYTGMEYKEEFDQAYTDASFGSPYFRSRQWLSGSVQYDGEYYGNLLLLYNVLRDKIVTEYPPDRSRLELVAEKVQRFTIDGHTFDRIESDSSQQLAAGFYELLCDGGVKLYAKHKKKMQRVATQANAVKLYANSFSDQTSYLIFKESRFYPVKNKSSLLQVFEKEKPVVSDMIIKNRIRFKRNKMEQAFVTTIQLYNKRGK